MQFKKLILLILFIEIITFGHHQAVFSQLTNLDWKLHNVGKVRQVITNMGTLDQGLTDYRGLIFSEFPPNSGEEHLYQGGLWIGALTLTGDTLVSVTKKHFDPGMHEFFPTTAEWDTVWVVGKNDTVDLPYWQNYVGVSDQDFVCRYSDYNLLNIEDHVPLYLDVIQTSYAWSSPPLDEFILFKYYIMPTRIPLSNVYVAFWMHSEIGTINAADNFIDEHTLYFKALHMAVAEDEPGHNDGTAISPIGYRILSPKDSTSSLKWTFKYYEHENLPRRDPEWYRNMSQGLVMENRLDPARAHIIVAFGPFESINVGDTLCIEMAEIFGYGMEGLLNNAEYLTFLKSKNFRVPSPPPIPVFNIATASHEVHLSWYPPDQSHNPEVYQDIYRGDNEQQPFEGYRLYKSTQTISGPWTLLSEFDIPNNQLGFNTGLAYEYRDTGLLNNVEYYYTLTAYSKPDSVANFPSQESTKAANARSVVPGTAPPETVGEVAAVPNPYRGDIAYNSYNPPWEKPQGTRNRWMEQDRHIQFINLPNDCEIKIYTLAGDLVETIYHSHPTRGYEDWNLTSSIGQAIASGIYMFTVQDKKNGKVQVGKFVIIK